MTRVAIIGARNHRALAQVWRRVRELPDGTTLVIQQEGDVAAVASIAARQRGLDVVAHPLAVAKADRVEAFPWDGDAALTRAVETARDAGLDVRMHPARSMSEEALLVFSAQRYYRGRCGFCVMRFGGGPEAEPFAPSAELLKPFLAERDRAKELRLAARQIASAQLRLGETPEERTPRKWRAKELEEQADAIEEAAWAAYRPQFLAEMRVSCGLTNNTPAWARRSAAERGLHEAAWSRGVRPHPEAWRLLLARAVVVLLCGCPREERCHRGILRAEILPAFGAVDGGELQERRPVSQRLLNLIGATTVSEDP